MIRAKKIKIIKRYFPERKKNNINKIFLIFLLIFPFINNSVSGQNIDLNKKISISAKNKNLSEVLTEIETKTDLNFAFNNNEINASQKITIIARNKNVYQILNEIFGKLQIKYTVVEKQIVLKLNSPAFIEEKAENKFHESDKYTISGYIRNSATGEALIGASIYVKNQSTGTVSNSYGFYSLTLPANKYNLTFSYISQTDQTIYVNLAKDINYNVNLEEKNEKIEIVLVTTENKNDFEKHNPLKITDIYSKSLEKNINIAGENDLIKSLSSVSGINSRSDGSIMFSARGGNYDQNIIYLDEAPVYNPSHFLGFFSAISPDAINKISVYKSDFPENIGGRLSSVIDIKTNDGSKFKTGFSGKLSAATGSWTIDGPIVKNKISYFVSLRNSHLNAFLQNTSSSVKFYDFHIKLNARINRKNNIFFSLFHGYDLINLDLNAQNSEISWNNSTLSLRWNHLYSDKLFSNTTIYVGKYDYFMNFSAGDSTIWNSLIGEAGIKNDFTFYATPSNTIKFGFIVKSNAYNPGNLNKDFLGRITNAGSASEADLYFGNSQKISKKISFSYKIRIISRNNSGPTTIYSFDQNHQVSDTTQYGQGIYKSFLNSEPRLSFSYQIDSSFTSNISYSRNIQYEQMLSNSASPFTTLDVWMPSGINIPPQKAHQFTFGLIKKIYGLNISFETYYKKLINISDFPGHPNLLLNPLIEGEIRTGIGKAYGAEFTLGKNSGNFQFAYTYSYSRAINKIEDVNFNRNYPATYDKPHNLKLNLSYNNGKRSVFSVNWQYSSGMRYSSPTSFFYFNGYALPIYEEKNNAKLPDYHRLDVSVKFILNRNENSKYKHSLTFSIYNLYNKKNYIGINFSKIETDGKSFYVPSNYIGENQIVPTATYLTGIFPAISYQFEIR